jgi:ABC-2 type transport system ATP-binding protein
MILGLDRPDRGSATIAGKPYRQLRDPIRTVGALLDADAAHRGRTAYHHLLWIAQSNRVTRARVLEVLQLVGLESVARRRIGGFSLGMRQRLGLAAALLGDPEVLLLDEPVNGLDPEGIRWMRDLLRGLAGRGRTVLVSSHLMTEMAMTADHLIVIGRGRLLADCPTDRFIENSAGTFVRVRSTSPVQLQAALTAAGFEVRSPGGDVLEVDRVSTDEVGRLAATQGIGIVELGSHSASLEDAFLTLTDNAGEFRASSSPQSTAPPSSALQSSSNQKAPQ